MKFGQSIEILTEKHFPSKIMKKIWSEIWSVNRMQHEKHLS